MTSSAERKISITLDADLVPGMEADGSTTLSAEVNSALRAEFIRRKVRLAMEAARRLRREVAIATGTLAELVSGAGRSEHPVASPSAKAMSHLHPRYGHRRRPEVGG